MSIDLIVEVLDHAPANLTPTERLLLIAIAEKANVETREGWPGMETLMLRTGLQRESVSKTLQRLAAKGYEVRVPLGKGSDGRPVYAFEGTSTIYRIPNFKSPDGGPATEGGQASGLPPEPGPPSDRARTTVRERADGGPALSLAEPSEEPSSSDCPAYLSRIIEVTGADDDEARAIVEKIKAAAIARKRPIQNLGGYLATVKPEHLVDHLADVRQARTPPAAAPRPRCGECNEFRQITRSDDTVIRCPRCHPLAQSGSAA